ncbi:hypothetical protein ACI77F_00600 [Pseudomonas tritici]|uniref:hypothetical protein n=1 Tax=Pseudomonas tritici TaxID=2745518 RepID=UPI00387B64C0
MRIVTDSRPNEILRLEDLLEGYNYTVWINTYGPFDLDRTLEEQLTHSVSKNAIVSNQTSVSPSKARREALELLLHPGDDAYGPIDLAAKRSEILALAKSLFTSVNLDQAKAITSFLLVKGHPAYPVYSGFSFDIQAHGKRWILMGSSSD